MNLLNRLIVILLMVGIILCSALTILGLAVYQSDVVDIFRQVAAVYPPGVGLSLPEIIGIGVVALVISLIAAAILWFEVVPGGAQGVRLSQVSGSNAVLTTDAITQRVKHDAEQVMDVRQARPQIRSNGKDVGIRLDLRLAPEANPAQVVETVGQVVRDNIETKMGVRIRRLNIYVKHESFAKKAQPPRTATSATTTGRTTSGL